MKHSEKEMLELTKKVLSDLQGQYFKEENLKKVVFNENKEINNSIYQRIQIACWTAVIIEPIFDASEFLTISDETGEPLYYQNANMIIHEIQKDNNGNYY